MDGLNTHVIRSMERPFLRRVSEWSELVMSRGRLHLTDFLTPREQVLLERFVADQDVTVRFYGGPEEAERKRALLLPEDWPMEPEDFHITLLSADLERGANISHGSVLGSILGTGIERRKIGDISVFEDVALVLVCEDIVPFLTAEWKAIGRHAMSPSPSKLNRTWPEPLYIRDIVEVTSLRADTVVSHACHLSRGKAQDAFEKKQVSLNFVVLSETDCPVAEGDILSVRGFGRVRVYGTAGQTKSGRFRLEVGILKSDQK